jgi:hypothetical protein
MTTSLSGPTLMFGPINGAPSHRSAPSGDWAATTVPDPVAGARETLIPVEAHGGHAESGISASDPVDTSRARRISSVAMEAILTARPRGGGDGP